MGLGGEKASNFQGDRGGDAYDAELLALLRGVSSEASDRFAGSDAGAEKDGNDECIESSQTSSPSRPSAVKSDVDSVVVSTPSKQTTELKPLSSSLSSSPQVAHQNDTNKAQQQPTLPKSADKQSIPPTLQGERGGDAHDEELLALLRGVSAKSGAADRFSGSDDNIDDGDHNVNNGDTTDASSSTNPTNIVSAKKSQKDRPVELKKTNPNSNDKNDIPSWKRGKTKANGNNNKSCDTDTTLVEAKPTPSQPTIISSPSGSVPGTNMNNTGRFEQTKSNFQGERGGDAHDEELLALLRGVSSTSGSGGADRFADENDQSAGGNSNDDAPNNSQNKDTTPPWKRKKTEVLKSTPNADTVNVVATAKPKDSMEDNMLFNNEEQPVSQESSMRGTGNFKKETSNFEGERGGDAHDEELLALLRGVSAKSESVDRFAEDCDVGVNHKITETLPVNASVNLAPKAVVSKDSICSQNPKQLPPWKRGKVKKNTPNKSNGDAIVTAKPKLPVQIHDAPAPEPSSQEFSVVRGGNFNKTKTNFKGERGGDAHDEELLALLRGVSSNSASADRFATNGGKPNEATDELDAAEMQQASSPPLSESPSLEISPSCKNKKWFSPPWKKNKKKNTNDNKKEEKGTGVELKQSTSEPSLKKKVVKSDQVTPTDVQQLGGGSFKQESTFKGERGGDAHDEELLALLRGVSSKTNVQKELPPANPKICKVSEYESSKDSEQMKENETPPSSLNQEPRGNFKNVCTFQGDRGGEAHDEELLALLRGVSSKAGGSDQFTTDLKEQESNVSSLQPSTRPSQLNSAPSPFPGGGSEGEITVNPEDLPSAFSDKNWKVRKQSYIVLKNMILETVKGVSLGSVDADEIIPGLDDLIPNLFAEKNAIALEFAMIAGTEYADACKGASSEEQAVKIASELFKGNGFSSPRPSSAKIVTSLVLKIMEVGSDPMSLTNVATLLVDKGLVSKKPKVVQLSASLILEASHSFGAANLPLAAISSVLPKILTHSNKKIRGTATEIVAEFCRAFGSKDPLGQVIEKMQKSRVKDLDTLLAKRADPISITTGLRCQGKKVSLSASDVFAALQTGNEELERERYLKRSAVNFIEAIDRTEYASKLKLAKWSEKVGAIEMVIQCAGEKPYKLAQPSTSNNYVPLISEMKGLLTHTHFAVVSKALSVLAVLAQGVGERLYPNFRPLLPKLLQLSKDKKLTKAVSSCLDASFGNVFTYEHLLDPESSIPDAANETKEKNKLARTSALEFLDRSIKAGASSGPRATLTPSNATSCAKFASQKLGDSDANVRKAALQILASLQKVEDEGVQSAADNVIGELKQSNPRAYKSLAKNATNKVLASATSASSSVPKINNKPGQPISNPPAKNVSSNSKALSQKSKLASHPKNFAVHSKPAVVETSRKVITSATTKGNDKELPNLNDATDHCGALDIPLWDDPDEDKGGILVCIKSTKWQSRLKALKSLIKFVESRPVLDDCNKIENDSTCLLLVVKEHTKKFKESNFNVTKGIMELFVALCDYHTRSKCRFVNFAAVDGTSLAVDKIADRKLSSQSKHLLLTLCTVYPPHDVLTSAFTCAERIRAPVGHEEFLLWMISFCNEFGAASISSGIQNATSFLVSECEAKNIKVKHAAFATLGLMHIQLGPSLKAIAVSLTKDSSFREELERVFRDNPFDTSIASSDWPMCYTFSDNLDDKTSRNSSPGMKIELPKTDLIAMLPTDCLSRLGSKDGKTAWKARKAALEDVGKAIKNTNMLLDTSKMRPLVELLRALRDRLTDTQINLKPVAARLLGLILGSVEDDAQGKLGKVVYAPIMNAAMNDKRKVMHDASMEALQKSISVSELNGGGFNEQSLEPFIVSLIGELEGSEFKSAGIAGIFTLTGSFVSYLKDLDSINSQGGQTIGGRFSRVLVNALSSSKTEIRSAAESLLSGCLNNNVFSIQTTKKSISHLVPAKQRSVGIVLAKISSSSATVSDVRETKEPSPSKLSLAHRSSASSKGMDSRPTRKTATQKPQTYPRDLVDKNRPSAHANIRVQNEVTEDIFPANPLDHNISSTSIQKSRAAMRSLTWPEYPEEPSGSALYNGLKKAWSPIIPPSSLKRLFPDNGIRKQDDVMDGFDVLRRAISVEKERNGSIVVEQLHFILRWSVYVMGCKESTIGLTGMLDIIAELLSYLRGLEYEFSDNEISIFAPFLFEKASVAKGRFKDTYMDLICLIKSDTLLPAKRLGPLVCVPLMESSSQAKGRLLACQTCFECVEKSGLSGIGKKGVIVAAKSLSNEKLPENRTAFLDLMVLLVSRMHNDTQRLSKICGSSLSNKARVLIEEYLYKAPSPRKASPAKITSSSHLPFYKNQIHPSPVSKLPASMSRRNMNTENDMKNLNHTVPSVFQDELPALDLRRALRDRESPNKSNDNNPTRSSHHSLSLSNSGLNRSDDLFSSSFKFKTASTFREAPVVGPTIETSKHDQINSHLLSASSESDQSGLLSSNTVGSSINTGSSPIGAAASLRARLMKIRESNKMNVTTNNTTSDSKKGEYTKTPFQNTNEVKEIQLNNTHLIESSTSPDIDLRSKDGGIVFEKSLEIIRKILPKPRPIVEDDEDLNSCIDVLKNIHAAVSRQENLAVMIDASAVTNLREDIKENISEVVEILTRLICFGFDCHPKTVSAGMSVPLLSVNLAGLMAIFRSSDLASLVEIGDLTNLIKEAGTALLDPRLAQKSGDEGQIDEATSTQMVRAINKLAVQAATGAAREKSLQSLIRLQDLLSSNNDAHDNSLFNSRLSRVVTKLFSRVIKAEESTPYPFSSTNIDIRAMLRCVEETTEGCRDATQNMLKLIVVSILKARGESATIRIEIENIGIDPDSSSLGLLINSCSVELGIEASTGPTLVEVSSSQNNDVTSLVSAKPSTTVTSDRIKNLRSKLIATQAAVAYTAKIYPLPIAKPNNEHYTADVDVGDGVDVEGNEISTSCKDIEDNVKSSSQSSSDDFRERLAAVQEKRETTTGTSAEILSSAPKTTASSRASALRARLEAVKKQNRQAAGYQ